MNGLSIQNRTIFPVVLRVPEEDQRLTGREKVSCLSRHARRAVEISAQRSGVVLPKLEKDERGAPVPWDGNYWSLSHKPRYVAGVVAAGRIGIDIERIRRCSEALFRKTAAEHEWAMSDTDRQTLFFRYWTAKECVLKAAGTGIRDLSKCRIVRVVDARLLVVGYREKQWPVEHFFFNGHIASVVKNDADVQWMLLRTPVL